MLCNHRSNYSKKSDEKDAQQARLLTSILRILITRFCALTGQKLVGIEDHQRTVLSANSTIQGHLAHQEQSKFEKTILSLTYMRNKQNRDDFALIPACILSLRCTKELSGSAFHLLLLLASRYNGHNNGDLSASYSQLKELGFNSHSKLTQAKQELLNSGLILEARPSAFSVSGGKCALYALSWQPIDECDGKHTLQPTKHAPVNYGIKRFRYGKKVIQSSAFAKVPTSLIESPKFITLTNSAKRILVLYASIYRGRNNGNLFLSRGQLRELGIASNETISKAIKALEEKGFLICTRKGRFDPLERREPRYAICWMAIDIAHEEQTTPESTPPAGEIPPIAA